ncbi:hypothetical protein D3Z51_16390 [Clostridiaceae bacterium]|nr:hypothetical protein [Clostridiaceae bacterium]RKI10272.1 hypothetical protein D7V81_15855 [bacterium 1XD21-70]
MHKAQKILGAIFLGGVLLGGIGTGIALVEYSSLVYAGERMIGEENLAVQELDYSFTPGQEQIKIIKNHLSSGAILETDSTVPEGTVRYIVTYNKKTIRPELIFWEDEPEEEWEEEAAMETAPFPEPANSQEGSEPGQTPPEMPPEPPEATTASPEQDGGAILQQQEEKPKQILLRLGTDYIGSEFALFMESKDEILTGLKEKKIFDYKIAYITDVKILVNPQSLQDVSFLQ